MKKIICWWSGGVTSAVACKLAIDLYGRENCRVIFMDTVNEDEDTYRFINDCSVWYKKPIEVITYIGSKYDSIQSVWRQYKSLNSGQGAICSSSLKRDLRLAWEKENIGQWLHQVFGFDISESKRARSMKLNHPQSNPIFPLMLHAMSKKECIEVIEAAGLSIPRAYYMGFLNNSCLKTGCVKGGIGYWQKMRRDMPEVFQAMADMEHELSLAAGYPVTCLKDQSNEAKEKTDKKDALVFLVKNPMFPNNKELSDMRECKVEPLVECNGFCFLNDLQK